MCRRQGGREAREIVEVMERRKVDIACVQETRWSGGERGCRDHGEKEG